MTEYKPRGEMPSANKQEKRERFISYTWGEGYPTYENHSVKWGCINDECVNFNKVLNDGDQKKWMIGVKEAPFVSETGNHIAQICECPQCFSQFWFHIMESTAKRFKERHLQKKTDERY